MDWMWYGQLVPFTSCPNQRLVYEKLQTGQGPELLRLRPFIHFGYDGLDEGP